MLAPVPQVLGPSLWLAVFAAVLVSAVTGATLVFAAIALAEGVFPSRRMAVMMGADLLVAVLSVGLAGAAAGHRGPPRGLAAAGGVRLLLAYRAYVGERTKHELEFLYGVARSRRAPDIESALVDLLRRTSKRSASRSRRSCSSRATSRCAALDRRGQEVRMAPLRPTLAAALVEVVGEGQHAVLLEREHATGLLALHGRPRDPPGAGRAGAGRRG